MKTKAKIMKIMKKKNMIQKTENNENFGIQI